MRAKCVSCVNRVIGRTLYAVAETANANRPEVRTVDMRNETSRATQLAWAALLACTGVVIAAGFALTFHGLYGFGRHIAHWGPALAALGPIADDGLTLVAIAATFLLAHSHAPRRPRVYAWFVFAVACAASVAGNTAYAMRPLPTWVGAVGAALCPLFVTLAAHLGVVCWRHSQHVAAPIELGEPAQRAPVDRRPAVDSPAHIPPPAGPTPIPVSAAHRAAAPTRGRRGGGQSADPSQRAAAVRRVIHGNEAMRAVARSIGCSEATVRNWVNAARQADTGNGHRLSPEGGLLSHATPGPRPEPPSLG